jgi:hypothetical protein
VHQLRTKLFIQRDLCQLLHRCWITLKNLFFVWTVNNCYIKDKQRPTTKKINVKLVQSIDFTGSLLILIKVLLILGFPRTNTKNNRRNVLERHNNRSHVRSIANYRSEGRTIDVTDKTYIRCSHPVPFGRSDASVTGLLNPFSKGQRVITVHAGSDQCLITDTYILLNSYEITADFHSDKTYTAFRSG